MAATGTPTPNIGLRRPQGTDPASVDDINYNSNLIDTKLGAVGNTSVQEQINSLNSNLSKSVSQENASPQSGESLFQLNGLQFYRARSSYDNGWVLELRGSDAAGKDVRVGFDKTGGIYCYYDNTLQWNVRP